MLAETMLNAVSGINAAGAVTLLHRLSVMRTQMVHLVQDYTGTQNNEDTFWVDAKFECGACVTFNKRTEIQGEIRGNHAEKETKRE